MNALTETHAYSQRYFPSSITLGSLLSWTYDRIGNRLTETRSGVTDTYTYQLVPAPGTGHSPILSSIALGAGGTRTYQYDPVGNLQQITRKQSSPHSSRFPGLLALARSERRRWPETRCYYLDVSWGGSALTAEFNRR